MKEGDDFSGNRLPGVAPNTFITTLNAQTKLGVYGLLSYNFTDEIPLNDANSVYSNAYHLVKGKLGFRQKFGQDDKFTLNLYAGLDNILDERYSLGYDINAFGNRFYQPAPPLNWFGGIKINYSIIN